ncbi:MAG: TlyA family RNA methyltransferase [Nitrospinae bacterium]|nr:TlyA family RNA methyltransferase [Nitrospinota bacterium]
MPPKKRLDQLLVERGLVGSRSRAQALIMAGDVLVGDVPATKAGELLPSDAPLRLRRPDHPYVSRGGLKLAHALDHFGVDPSGMVCLDIGASTGGFTDCLLRRGAVKVWAIDVGSNQLDYRLRADPRVVSREGVNARDPGITALVGEPIDLIVSDVSFISLTLAIPPSLPLLRPGGRALLLVKPQFEAGREAVGKGGYVADEGVRQGAVGKVVAFFSALGLIPLGVEESPVTGAASGNVEYLALFARPGNEETAKKNLDTEPATP